MTTVTLRSIQVVVFDLDDTLYLEKQFACSGFMAVAEWLKPRIRSSIDLARRMRELFDQGERGHVFDRLLAELGMQDSDRLIPEMVACYRSHRPGIHLCPDAEQVLNRWQGHCRLGLISDGPLEMQRNKVDALGLIGRLDPIILTDQWGRNFWKPHERAFQEIEALLGISGHHCLYVADNCGKDFVAPNRLGWQTVHIHRPDGVYAHASSPPNGSPQHQVSKLTDIELSY